LPTYETLFITPPNLPEDEERATVDAMAQVVADGGGTMIANDRMGRRRLGYPIRKFEDGVYVRFLYDAESEVPKELERRIRLSDRVLRSLTVRLDREWAEAAKQEAVDEARRRVEEAERKAAEAEAGEGAEAAPPEAVPGEATAEATASAGDDRRDRDDEERS